MFDSLRRIKSRIGARASIGGRLSSVESQLNQHAERQLLLQGRLLSDAIGGKKKVDSLREVEFKVFSQFGDDGIIQWLVNNLEIPHQTFIEFGVEDYQESNTRFLMMNNNWSGLVMDGSEENVRRIRYAGYFWRHELYAEPAFVDCENVNRLISSVPFDEEIGLLHVDLDGVDYWIWKEISSISPIVVILEYNSVFGRDRAITVPYDSKFHRTEAHHSNLFFGASLPALCHVSEIKGYSLVGCNSAGNNAYFVRNDKLNEVVRASSIEDAFVVSRFRESRDPDGQLTYLAGEKRLEAIAGMKVYDVRTESIEEL